MRCAVDIRNVDVGAASAVGVLVTQAGPGFVQSVAELALGFMVDLSRGVSRATADYHAGRKPGTSGFTRFVQASAGTGGTGTSVAPYNLLSTAITNASTVEKDILMLRPGTYTAATLNKPMTIRATRNGPAIIQKP